MRYFPVVAMALMGPTLTAVAVFCCAAALMLWSQPALAAKKAKRAIIPPVTLAAPAPKTPQDPRCSQLTRPQQLTTPGCAEAGQ
jgi:hypothetical protein